MNVQHRLSRAWTRLFELEDSSYGKRLLWVTLTICCFLIFDLNLDYADLPPAYTVSVLGLFLPLKSVSQNGLNLLRAIFLLCSALWVARKCLPWCAWSTVAAFTIMVSIYWENLPWFRHKFIIPNLLLIVLALCCQFHRDGGRREPRWVGFASLWVVLSFYGLSGIAKLRGGWNFGDGTSLQIWFWTLVDDSNPLKNLIIHSQSFAALAQTGVLCVELSCFFALFLTWYRVPLAVLLVGFHLVVQWTFAIPFLSNIPLILAVLLPFGLPGTRTLKDS